MSSGMLRRDISCRFIIIIITAKFMTHVICRLTAKNWDQLRNPTLGNRVRFMTMQVGVVRGKRSLQRWSCEHPRSVRLHRAVAEMMVLDDQPASVVSRPGLRTLISLLEPRYTLPSETYLRHTALPQVRYINTG